ncbi:MAG TPA: catalase [Clostridia bacterium]|nr:catalase [Clostridia bacterium]
MQRPNANDFDHASLEAMMERYRAELLRYQRATPPGKPTLAQNLETSERGRAARPVVSEPKYAVPPKTESMPVAQTVFENKKVVVQPEVRRERVVVETPPMMLLPTLTSRPDSAVSDKEQPIILPQTSNQQGGMTESEAQVCPPALIPKLMPAQTDDTALGQSPKNSLQESSSTNTAQIGSMPVAEPRKLAGAPMPPLITNSPAGQMTASEVPSALKPMPQMSMPYVQPGQMSATNKSDRAIPPIKTDQSGCIAHTEFEKGAGAYGVFRPYERMGKYTLASFLQTPGEAVQTLVRFAADVPMGSADAIRCRRSFTVKFFCREGEYDLFGMHLPVSVGTTEKTLADCCAASRANPKTGLRTRADFWEFLVTHPEALHAAMWLYSDLGTIGSYRTIDGYGLPCLWVNAQDERRVVRPRWLSRQRPQTLTRFEAEELAGSDPDAVTRDLAESLRTGERPQYELSIQVIEPEQLASLSFDPFDPTAIWPTEQFKPQRIGLLTLERPPDDAAVELDCARFQPENIVPGIEHVPAAAPKSGDDFKQVQQYLRSLGEFARHRLIDNLSEELLRLPPLLLEQVLILFSRADLEFGQAMTLALGG